MLIGLVLLLNVATWVLTFDNIRVSSRTGVLPVPNVEEPNRAVVRSFDRPLVVLVLDVSGSMITSDPKGQQADAVKNFLRLYHAMVQDVLKPGDRARLAVVLFATTAQVLEWPGAQGRREPFLVLPETEKALELAVDNALNGFIAKKGTNDPRQGWQTDYYEACKAVQSLLARSKDAGPPCVIFMTDGKDTPFVPFIPMESDQRERLLRELARNMTNLVRERYMDVPNAIALAEQAARALTTAGLAPPKGVSSGERLCDAPRDCVQTLGKVLAPCFSVAQNRLTLTPSARETREKMLHGLLRELARQDFALLGSLDKLPMIWEFIYLGTETPDVEFLTGLAHSLQRTEERWHLSYHGVLQCRTADQLQGSFMDILGQWLNLEARPLARGTDSFVVEPRTSGIALALQTSQKTAAVQMLGPNNERIALTQCVTENGKVSWFGAVGKPSSGLWRIDPAGEADGGTIWARQRYRWDFGGVPKRLSPLRRSSVISLRVYDVADGLPVPASGLYTPSSLPALIEARLSPPGGAVIRLPLVAERDAQQNVIGYTNSLPPLPQGGEGKLAFETVLSGLTFVGTATPLPPQTAKSEINLMAFVDLQLQTEQGQPTASLDFQRVVPGMAYKGAR